MTSRFQLLYFNPITHSQCRMPLCVYFLRFSSPFLSSHYLFDSISSPIIEWLLPTVSTDLLGVFCFILGTLSEGICVAGKHKWKHDQCMVCAVCGECTGYGASCVSSGRPGDLSYSYLQQPIELTATFSFLQRAAYSYFQLLIVTCSILELSSSLWLLSNRNEPLLSLRSSRSCAINHCYCLSDRLKQLEALWPKPLSLKALN